MPAFPRDDDPSNPADDESEGNAWAKAFDNAKPDPDNAPLTDDEKALVRDLMIRAAETGDHESIDRLAELSKTPAELRQLLASFDEAAA